MSIVAGTWMVHKRMMDKVRVTYPCASYPKFGFRFLAYVCGEELYNRISAGRDVASHVLAENAFEFNEDFENQKNVLIKNSALYKNWESMGLKCCPDVYFSAKELDRIFENVEFYNSRLGVVGGEIHTVNFIYENIVKSDFSFDVINTKLVFKGRSQKNISADKWIPNLQLVPDERILEVEPFDKEKFIHALKDLN